MFERFTKPARQVVLDAVKAADRIGQQQVRPEHLLLGVAMSEEEVGASVLAGFGIDAARVERAITRRDPRTVLSDAEMAALRAVGIDADEVFRRIEDAFGDSDWFLADASDDGPERRPLGRLGGGRFDKDARNVMVQSLRQAVALKHRRIGSEHILLGLLSISQPPLPDLLTAHGVTYEQARQRVLAALQTTA
jgi:ATP-dependent Clp protease ATP-binding subunit ClpA